MQKSAKWEEHRDYVGIGAWQLCRTVDCRLIDACEWRRPKIINERIQVAALNATFLPHDDNRDRV